MTAIDRFIESVLGPRASGALAKAVSRHEALGPVVGPRVILGWVNLASQWSYSGNIPGIDGSILSFQKTEDGLKGSVGIGNDVYDFVNASPTELSATLAVTLGVGRPIGSKIKDCDLVGLGKSVDVLVKSQIIELLRASVAKTELTGAAAAPQGPKGPMTPEAPQKAPKVQQQSAPKTLRITKNQAENKCSVCGAGGFEDDHFVGCFCLRELAKTATSVETQEGYEIEFGTEWTPGSIQVCRDILGV
jgi:hypothetical protein